MPSGLENSFLYLPIIESNLLWDLYITGIGFAEIGPDMPYPPVGHPEVYDFRWTTGRVLPEYQILYISKGRGTFESNYTARLTIGQGSIILLFPDVWHRYRPDPKTGWREHWISWNGEYLYRLFKRGFITPENAVLHGDCSTDILGLYTQIRDLAREDTNRHSHQMAACGMQILTLALERMQPQAGDSNIAAANRVGNESIVNEAIRIIWSHSHRNTTVDQLTEYLPVARRTLERKFRKSLGHSIGREITRARIERAKQLLTSTNLPVEHIALAVGFSGADYLCKVFRRFENITPGKYRKAIR